MKTTKTTAPHTKRKQTVVGIVLFDMVEVLDFCGPFEVFSVARRAWIEEEEEEEDHGDDGDGGRGSGAQWLPASAAGAGDDRATAVVDRRHPRLNKEEEALFDVYLVSAAADNEDEKIQGGGTGGSSRRPPATVIKATGGMEVLSRVTFDDCPELDVLLIPGGKGTRIMNDKQKREIVDFVRRHVVDRNLEVLASVCTGALILAEAGLLNGLTATTHHNSIDILESKNPNVVVERSCRWTCNEPDDGSRKYALYTSAGISAGIDMSLKIVERLYGEDVARKTAIHMEYPFPESNTCRRNNYY